MSEHARRRSDWSANEHYGTQYRESNDGYDHYQNAPYEVSNDQYYDEPTTDSSYAHQHRDYDPYDNAEGSTVDDQQQNSHQDNYVYDSAYDSDRDYHQMRDHRYEERTHYSTPHPDDQHPGSDFLHDYQAGDRIEPDFSEPADYADDLPYTDDVWLKEKQGRISFSDHDLRDVQRPKHGSMATTMAGFAGVAAMLGLIGFLAYSSLPELSPQEIIAMQGYAGEQPTKTPFNLASLRECEAGADCADSMAKPIIPITATTAAATTTGATTAVTTTSIAEPASTTITYTDGFESSSQYTSEGYTVIQEIPAATNATYESTSYESTSYESASSDSYTSYSSDQLVVLQQWSNVRSTPEINGDILTSLAEGTNVKKLSETGQWVEVEVSNRRSVIGYMHRSTVAAQ